MEVTTNGRPGRVPAAAWVVLIGLFAVTATYIVRTVPPSDAPPPAPPTPVAPTTAGPAHSDGLSERHDGFTLEPLTLPTRRGAGEVAFRILGPAGSPVTAYATVQDRPLHLYLAREDLSVFQHVHPRLVDDTWRATVDVPDGGVYRIYAEFTPPQRPAGVHPTVLGVRFIITGDTRQVPLPSAEPMARAGPYTVKRLDGAKRQPSGRQTTLRLQVLDAGGRPVSALQPYLGAYAHVSAFDVLTQALTHVHPVAPPAAVAPPDGVLDFQTVWPAPGAQRIFVEFQVAGVVHRAALTVVIG
jgi:hypothetical protein